MLTETAKLPDNAAESMSPNLDLSCLQMWLDGIKASKLCMDPISSCVGAVVGTICCIAVTAVNNKNDKQQVATRYDVTHSEQIRRAEAAEEGSAFAVGYCLGDLLIDTLSLSVGVLSGGARAAFFKCTKNNQRDNTIFGYTRPEIDQVKLFDSCCCNVPG